MAFRNLMIENRAFVSIRHKNLSIKIDAEHSVPIEDINSILIENAQSTITTAALSALAQNGATVYICDAKHTPCAVMLPFVQHSRSYGMLKLQEGLTQPQKKRLWQQIVIGKIDNQAKCLELSGRQEDSEHLRRLEKKVTSGDATNIEAEAAGYYFTALMGREFYRSDENDVRNAALNYGYAIIRGQIARLIVSYGFLPLKGIHHRSELNGYNLADDLIEPFRPLVDLFVVQYFADAEADGESLEALTPPLKRALYNLLNMDILSDGQSYSVAYAAERLVQSFTRCCEKVSKELLLPELVPLKLHSYE